MGLVRYFVLRHESHWLVTLEGRAMAHLPNRAEAINSAIVMADLMGAMGHDSDVMADDGETLELVWTYGRDPLPGQTRRKRARRRSPNAAGSPRSHVRLVSVPA